MAAAARVPPLARGQPAVSSRSIAQRTSAANLGQPGLEHPHVADDRPARGQGRPTARDRLGVNPQRAGEAKYRPSHGRRGGRSAGRRRPPAASRELPVDDLVASLFDCRAFARQGTRRRRQAATSRSTTTSSSAGSFSSVGSSSNAISGNRCRHWSSRAGMSTVTCWPE